MRRLYQQTAHKGKQFLSFLLFALGVYIVRMKKDARMGLRVSAEMAEKFEGHAARLNQSASNLLVMLMEALCRAMDRDGHVVTPIEVKTPSDCVAPATQIHLEHNGIGHQKAGKIHAKRG